MSASLLLAVLLAFQTAAASPPERLLKSRGYSWILDRSGDGFRLYQQVGGACWLDGDGEALKSIFARERQGDGELVRLSEDGDQATVYAFDHVPRLPAGCDRPDRSDRAAVAAIADLMASRYPGFEARGVDFAKRRDAVLSGLPEHPTPIEAFSAAEGLLAGLADPHIELSAEIEGVERSLTVSEGATLDAVHARKGERPERAWLRAWRQDIEQVVLAGNAHVAANNRVIWGTRDGIGYLTIVTMGGFDPEDDLATGPLDKALDEAIAAFADARAVIVDVSNNRGGYDSMSLRIAARFADRARVVYLKRGWGSGVAYQPVELRPAEGPRYLGPVWLLTSDITVSAGETFTQAMRVLPNVTQAGTATRGAFSDQIPVRLANGWRFAMPMEIYLDPQGRALEGRGLRPRERIELYPSGNLDHGHGEAVLRLMARLRSSAHG